MNTLKVVYLFRTVDNKLNKVTRCVRTLRDALNWDKYYRRTTANYVTSMIGV